MKKLSFGKSVIAASLIASLVIGGTVTLKTNTFGNAKETEFENPFETTYVQQNVEVYVRPADTSLSKGDSLMSFYYIGKAGIQVPEDVNLDTLAENGAIPADTARGKGIILNVNFDSLDTGATNCQQSKAWTIEDAITDFVGHDEYTYRVEWLRFKKEWEWHLNGAIYFTINQYTVTFKEDADDAGTTELVDYNGLANGPEEEPARDGQEFTGWETIDGEPFDLETDVITGDIVLIAKFEDKTQDSGDGNGSGDTQEPDDGDDDAQEPDDGDDDAQTPGGNNNNNGTGNNGGNNSTPQTPNTGNNGGSNSTQQTPNTGNNGGSNNTPQTPDNGDDDAQEPDDGDDNGTAGDNKGTQAPDNGSDDTQAPDNGSDDTQAPDNGNDDAQAPDNGSDDTQAPDNGSDDTQAPDNGSGDTQAPDNGSDDTQAPDNGNDDAQAPDNGSNSGDSNDTQTSQDDTADTDNTTGTDDAADTDGTTDADDTVSEPGDRDNGSTQPEASGPSDNGETASQPEESSTPSAEITDGQNAPAGGETGNSAASDDYAAADSSVPESNYAAAGTGAAVSNSTAATGNSTTPVSTATADNTAPDSTAADTGTGRVNTGAAVTDNGASDNGAVAASEDLDDAVVNGGTGDGRDEAVNGGTPDTATAGITDRVDGTIDETAEDGRIEEDATPDTDNGMTEIIDEDTPLADNSAGNGGEVEIDDEDTPLASNRGGSSAVQVRIDDEATPLAAAEDNCIIHWIILLLTLIAGIYNVVRAYVRSRSEEETEETEKAASREV